ncbi:DUF305 domain-containing protein [Blastococcus saxobsidens]|uniref:DUF305 domain-containing protein n=1 Tax=Blastococcus saxobsidens (strain DD2) TaxID=1146883 RepID=H6RJ26_BLASD|nr:DUF305 domain-containing protein [Blastococcus saxobsidens]CCG04771.1 conserved exported protein of unknown function [Blastococcus saxobsidens DD2]
MTSTPDPARRPLRAVLLAVIGVGLVLLGGGLAVAVGVGQDPDPTADSVDAGFARDMSLHHLQGVEMANLAPERSDDPDVEQLAFDISATQTNQAGRMQGWLSLWGISPTGGDTMAWMPAGEGGHGGHDTADMDMGAGALMPGMATEDELAELRSLSGTAFDVEFLKLMIRHHQGGFDMGAYAAEHAEEEAVRDLARSIVQSQGTETATMTDMLAARGGTPLPAP